VWLFLKLAKYGKGIFRPNFERMQRKIEESTIFTYNGFFAYNHAGGKIFYYLTLCYNFILFFLFIYVIISSFAK